MSKKDTVTHHRITIILLNTIHVIVVLLVMFAVFRAIFCVDTGLYTGEFWRNLKESLKLAGLTEWFTFIGAIAFILFGINGIYEYCYSNGMEYLIPPFYQKAKDFILLKQAEKMMNLYYDKDIDLENRKIYIRRTQTKDNNGKAIIGNTTKTNTGQRTLNMNNIIYQIIQGALEHKVDNKEHLLFCKEDRTMYVENSINSCLKRIALDLNVGIYEEENAKGQVVKKTDIHTHMLRGTFATRCAEAKIAPAVLKKILGHTDITVTMKYYVDVDVEFEKAENKNVEDYLIDKEIFNVDSDYDYDYA